MTPRESIIFTIVATGVLVVAMVLASLFALAPNAASFRDSGAVLAVVGFSSVGIERVIEGVWIFIGLLAGAWWPLSDVGKQLNDMVTNLDKTLAPFYQDVSSTIDAVAKTANWGQQEIDAAKKEVADFQSYLDDLKKLPPDNQRAQLIAGVAQQSVTYFQTKYPDIENVARLATEATSGISDFVATFKDQPGRRLISLYIGILLGLIVAGVFSLNLLAVIVAPDSRGHFPWYVPGLGIILTGIVMGLGSSPAHEIIQAIQQFKQNLKSQGNAIPADGTITAQRRLVEFRQPPSQPTTVRQSLNIRPNRQ